ncbi:protein kinase [bacterium]|nr:protein kinase [bacterium]
MDPGNTTNAGRLLNDTLAELQAQLQAQRDQASPGTSSTPIPLKDEGTRARLEEAVSELARKAGFEVVNVLGVGGMGAVVKAVDMKLKRTVAMKFLPPELIKSAGNVAQLRKEAELASSVAHENVVQILSWHEVDGVPFFVMEFVEGETVEDLVRRRGRLPAYEALRIASQAARGMEALHAIEIIHRDLKPQNILIARDGRVKIADFGISRTKDMIQEEAQVTRVAGTPKYMSPEQARGEAALRQSDIYSLAATLYFMLTGRSPVEPAPDVRVQIANVREGRLVPITQLLPKIDKPLARLVMRSLSLNVSRRPFDMAQFRQQLEEVFIGQTEAASSPAMEHFRLYWRLAIPVVTLVVGIFLGFKFHDLGSRQPATPAPSNISRQAMYRIAQFQQANLTQLAQFDPSSTEAADLAIRLGAAQDAENDDAVAGLIPAAERAVRRWEMERLLTLLSSDTKSPFAAESQNLLARMRSASTAEIDAVLKEFPSLWYRFLATKAPPRPIVPEAGTAELRRRDPEQMPPAE